MTRQPPADLSIIATIYANWSRIETRRRAQSDDLKAIFAEAKHDGFNAKALRLAFAEQYRLDNQTEDQRVKAESNDTDFELYMSALARVREDGAKIDPVTGEIIEDTEPAPASTEAVAAAGGEESGTLDSLPADTQSDERKLSVSSQAATVIELGDSATGVERTSDSHSPDGDTQSTAARKDVQEQPARRGNGPSDGHQPNLDRSGAMPKGGDVPLDTRQPAAGTQAPPVDTHPIRQDEPVDAAVDGPQTVGGRRNSPEPTAPSNVTPLRPKKQWKLSDPAHKDCLNPEQCGGFSNLGLCQRCKEAATAGQVA